MSNREDGAGRLVWLPDEDNPRLGVWGTIVGPLGTYYTTIAFIKGGMQFEVLMENTEFEIWEEPFEYDDSDG